MDKANEWANRAKDRKKEEFLQRVIAVTEADRKAKRIKGVTKR